MSEQVAVACATPREVVRAGNTSPLFPAAVFGLTYFFNHKVTFEVQQEARRKQSYYLEKNLQHKLTEIQVRMQRWLY